MHAGYQGSMHTTPGADMLIWHIADKARDLSLQTKLTCREGAQHAKLTPDLHATGKQKFSSSSLATFNKKISNVIEGKVAMVEAETDDLPVLAFVEKSGIFGDEIAHDN